MNKTLFANRLLEKGNAGSGNEIQWFKERISRNRADKNVRKSQHSPMIYEKSTSVSIMKCVALQKSGQMCKLKENCSVG